MFKFSFYVFPNGIRTKSGRKESLFRSLNLTFYTSLLEVLQYLLFFDIDTPAFVFFPFSFPQTEKAHRMGGGE